MLLSQRGWGRAVEASEDNQYEVEVSAFGITMTMRTSARSFAEAIRIAERVYDVRIETKLIERSKDDHDK